MEWGHPVHTWSRSLQATPPAPAVPVADICRSYRTPRPPQPDSTNKMRSTHQRPAPYHRSPFSIKANVPGTSVRPVDRNFCHRHAWSATPAQPSTHRIDLTSTRTIKAKNGRHRFAQPPNLRQRERVLIPVRISKYPRLLSTYKKGRSHHLDHGFSSNHCPPLRPTLVSTG